MKVVDAVWQSFGWPGQAPSASSSPDTLVRSLIAISGSGRNAARILGVSPSTVYRWRDGKAKPRIAHRAIAAAIRAFVASRAGWPQLKSDIRRRRKGLVVHGVVAASSDVRVRTISVGMNVSPARQIGMIEKWIEVDDESVDRRFDRMIDDYVRGARVESVDKLWWGR